MSYNYIPYFKGYVRVICIHCVGVKLCLNDLLNCNLIFRVCLFPLMENKRKYGICCRITPFERAEGSDFVWIHPYVYVRPILCGRNGNTGPRSQGYVVQIG